MHSKYTYDRFGFSFNPTGPRGRWDHHGATDSACVLYTACDLATAFLEISMDTEEFTTDYWYILYLETSKKIKLLDLRASGCLAISSNRDLVAPSCPREISQEWSRKLHTHLDFQGIIWESAASGSDCVFLNEKAQDSLNLIKHHKASLKKYRQGFLRLGFDFNIAIY